MVGCHGEIHGDLGRIDSGLASVRAHSEEGKWGFLFELVLLPGTAMEHRCHPAAPLCALLSRVRK